MRIVYEYSHLGGAEIMKVRYAEREAEINAAIAAVGALPTLAGGAGSEHTLPSSAELLRQFEDAFGAIGYREWRETRTFALPYSEESVAAEDTRFGFIKGSVLIAVQLGGHASMYYDLVTFQHLFDEGKCDVGVEIAPCYALHQRLADGSSSGEQIIDEIERFRPHAPIVPVKIILVDA